MNLIFENEIGRVCFRGKSTGQKTGAYIKTMTGLGLPEQECRSAVYANSPGQTVMLCRDLERVITLSVDICSAQNVQEEFRRIVRVLYHPGMLTIISGTMRRTISCRFSGMDSVVHHGKNLISVVWQFICDHPYFTDVEPQKEILFSRENQVRDTFTLPCVFTERITRKIISNQGDLLAEPILEIYNTRTTAPVEVAEGDFGFRIINHTTGKQLELLCRVEPGEQVTIHVPKRRITGSVQGNLIAALGSESYLNDFYLTVGCNDIEVISHNYGDELSVLMTYERQYVEAVV